MTGRKGVIQRAGVSFEEFIAQLELRNFNAAEVLVATGRPGNSRPPQRLWCNIVPGLLILDDLRDRFGAPVRITSCYRARHYNNLVGGGRLSQHPAFKAIDFTVDGVAPSEVQALLRHWRGAPFVSPVQIEHAPLVIPGVGQVPGTRLELDDLAGFIFRGGVGCYDTFTHLDTRGYDADWRG